MKILLLGAYGNGNIGDMYQADALAGAIHNIAPAAAVFSISPSSRNLPFPVNGHEAVPQERLADAAFLNSFDLLLVGGGGLLASSHYPLHDDDWVDSIRIPMCGMSLGATGGPSVQAKNFVKKCALFSVRDRYSADAVAKLRTDVRIVMDPILLADVLEGEPVALAQERRTLVCIPAKLRPETREFYGELVGRKYMQRGTPIVSFNEPSDRSSGFDETFGPGVHYVRTLKGAYALMQNGRCVLSERYHGCILAIRAGVPCAGLTLRGPAVASKIEELYRRLSLTKCLFDGDRSPRPAAIRDQVIDSFATASIANELAIERKTYLAYLADCIARAGRAAA